MASIHLTVSQPFGSYKRGDLITDPVLVKSIKRGPYRHNVVQMVSHPAHQSGDFWRTDKELAERKDESNKSAD